MEVGGECMCEGMKRFHFTVFKNTEDFIDCFIGDTNLATNI